MPKVAEKPATIAERIVATTERLSTKREELATLKRSEAIALADGGAVDPIIRQRRMVDAECESLELLLDELKRRKPAEERRDLIAAIAEANRFEAEGHAVRQAAAERRNAAELELNNAQAALVDAEVRWTNRCSRAAELEDKLTKHRLQYPDIEEHAQ